MHYIYLITAIFFMFSTSAVSADTGGQYGQYGNDVPSASILVDKTVGRDNSTFIDNYAPSDDRFSADHLVYFQIRVKNISNKALRNVQMSDILPSYVDAVEGPGEYNATNRTISWKYSELIPGEERTEKLILKIKPQPQLPPDRGSFCVNNKSIGRSGDVFDEDTAQFCIEKKLELTKGGVPTQSPKAGADFGLIVSVLNIAGLGAGIYLRRKI